MNPTIAALMFVGLFALIFLGVPVSLSLIIPAALAGWFAFGPYVFDQLYGSLYTAATNYVLAAIPMFILMGAILERSGIAARLFRTMQLWVGRLPGGLAIATIGMGAIFAAAAGVVGAVEVMVGLMALPAMKSFGYRNSLAAGAVCAGGSLGTMIPPSVVAIVYASLAQISVGEIFAALLFPGLIMVGLFILYILIICIIRPDFGPRATTEDMQLPLAKKLRVTASGLLPALLLIIAVLGSLMMGIASPTEAAAVGAVGALILSISYNKFSIEMLWESLKITVKITAMIMLIVAGGIMFTGIFTANGGAILIKNIISFFGLGITGTLILFLIIIFLLGFVLDWTANVLICVPLFLPIIAAGGIDPIWFGVMVLVVIQTGYLTPPMASSIFYLLSIAPKDMKYGEICRGVVPFIGAQMATLLMVAIFPWLATWLPSKISGF